MGASPTTSHGSAATWRQHNFTPPVLQAILVLLPREVQSGEPVLQWHHNDQKECRPIRRASPTVISWSLNKDILKRHYFEIPETTHSILAPSPHITRNGCQIEAGNPSWILSDHKRYIQYLRIEGCFGTLKSCPQGGRSTSMAGLVPPAH
jgi:hypothetical protein